MNRSMINIVLVLFVLGGVGGVLWLSRPKTAAPEREVRDLPPLPAVEPTAVDDAVREQIASAQRATEANPYDATANGRLGMLYELYQYPEVARTCYERAALISPDEFRWHYYLGRIQKALGDPAAAVGTLERAVEINPVYTPAVALLGEAQLEEGRVADAEATFRAALESSPRSCSARLGLGKTLARQGDHERALEEFARALEVAPDHRPLHYAMALSYRAVDKMEDAKRHSDLASNSEFANPDPDPLVTEFLRLEIGVNADYRRAKDLVNSGRFDEALVILRKIVAEKPEHYGAHGAMGKALMLMRQDSEALAVYERAIALNPSNVDFLRPCSLLYYRARRYEDAERQLRRVRELGGDHADDHHILGAVLLKLKRRPEAIESFARAIEVNPDHTEARNALTKLLREAMLRAPTDEAAIPYLRRLTAINPRDAESWALLGGLLSKTGDPEGALAAFETAIELRPAMPQVRQRIAALRRELGRPPDPGHDEP